MCHVPSVVNDLSFQIYAPLNGCVTKAIASFYWDDSETVFRGLLTIYILILYLPTFSETNAWDFHLVMTEISGNVPATSEDFRQISEDFRPLSKIKCPLTVPEDVWALSKLLKTTLLACLDVISFEQKRGLSYHVLRTKLSLMRGIDVLLQSKGVSWLSWLCFSRTPRVFSGLTPFLAHYFISGFAKSVYSPTICQTHPFIQWLPLHLTPLQIFCSVPEKEVELSLGISTEYHYGRYKRRAFFSEKNTGGGVLPIFYNGLYGKTPPERGIFFRLQVYEREEISPVEVYEKVGKSVYIFDL